MGSPGLHVIIVGGSITGITLALCLERLDVPYTLLEKHNDIKPHIGGSLAVNPNGAFVLDQLGVWDDIKEAMHAFDDLTVRIGDDFSYTLKYARDLRNLLQYPLGMIYRQKLIDILYSHIRHKERIHTGCKVDRICDGEDSYIRVFDSNGKEYQGSFVVGADGISSFVRSQLHVNPSKPGVAPGAEPFVTCEHACVFGTSTNVPNCTAGLRIRSEKGLTLFAESLNGYDMFWMVFIKLKNKHQWPHKLKYSKQDAISIVEGMLDKKYDAGFSFGDVWSRTNSFDMVPIEEGVFSKWCSGRIVCIGDAVHKVCPNTGQGANMAIEDAAGIANLVFHLQTQATLHGKEIDPCDIERRLQDFEKTHKARAKQWTRLSQWVIRMHAHDGFLRTWVNSYLMPALDPWLARMTSGLLLGGVLLEYVDPPAHLTAKNSSKLVTKQVAGVGIIQFVLELTVLVYLVCIAIRVLYSYL